MGGRHTCAALFPTEQLRRLPPGRGYSIVIILALNLETALAQGPIPMAAFFRSNHRMGEHRLVIAVVDDEEGVRKALRRLFLAINIEGRTFETGEAFLASLETSSPDCVVLDLQMPGMTGLDVLERLAARETHLPTVIVTAYDEPGSRERCLAAGAAAYLRKPLDEHILIDTIEDVVGQAQRSFATSARWTPP